MGLSGEGGRKGMGREWRGGSRRVWRKYVGRCGGNGDGGGCVYGRGGDSVEEVGRAWSE